MKLIRFLVPLALASCAMTAAHASPLPPVSADALVYTHEEMFHFDTADWLARHAPHLSAQAEVIAHWAGYSAVSPRVLLALMEQQTGAVTRRPLDPATGQRPFGTLVEARGFSAQTREVALRLADSMFDLGESSATGPVRLARGNPLQTLMLLAPAPPPAPRKAAGDDFQRTYARLFGSARMAPLPSSGRAAQPRADALPPPDLLRFPWPEGKRWHVGGAHGDSGTGRYPMNAIDFFVQGAWGSNQSNYWVAASAAGTFKRHSSCMAEVVHGGGYSTVYYHLGNMQPQTGAQLVVGAAIANPANTMRQALCNGGFSTGPHQHWSLRYNGRPVHLNGVTLNGFRIAATGNSYETSCRVFNLTRNGRRTCSGYYTNRAP